MSRTKHRAELLYRYLIIATKRLTDRQLMILLAIVVGLAAGLATYVFQHTLEFFRFSLTSWFDIDKASVLYFFYPVVGIVIATLFVRYVVRDDISEGVTRVLYAMSKKGSRIKPHNCYSSIIASSATIGFGGSVGPEAPIVLTGSAIGSNIGRFMRMNYKNSTLLLCCGAAAALGAEFLDEEGRAFVPTGGTLTQIAHIRMEGLRETLAGAEVTVMCDIDNPLCGPAGAAAVFGPQKGADAAMVARMDAGLRHLAETLEKDVGMEVLTLAGGGSAGGFGAGAAAFFGGQLRMGIDVVLDLTDFDRKCRGASLVITGEGHLDSQSLRGKTVVGVARRARALGVPAAALVGGCETALDAVYAEGVSGVFPIHPALCTWPQAAARTEEDLRFTMGNLLRFMAALRR